MPISSCVSRFVVSFSDNVTNCNAKNGTWKDQSNQYSDRIVPEMRFGTDDTTLKRGRRRLLV